MSTTHICRKIKTSSGKYLTLHSQSGNVTAQTVDETTNQAWTLQPAGAILPAADSALAWSVDDTDTVKLASKQFQNRRQQFTIELTVALLYENRGGGQAVLAQVSDTQASFNQPAAAAVLSPYTSFGRTDDDTLPRMDKHSRLLMGLAKADAVLSSVIEAHWDAVTAFFSGA
ncbi:hypothetical protein BU15DRAFT_65098 [Melanogaster broomeanus]|nr:hypothetical protein BU15DRAFT_65098 [Melanogaster broomeanus]